MRATARFVPEQSGTYTFGLTGVGPSRLYLGGRQVIDNWTNWSGGSFFGMGPAEITYHAELMAGQEYVIVVEFAKDPYPMCSAARLGVLPPVQPDMLERAAALADQHD